jgi:hypothetical protein
VPHPLAVTRLIISTLRVESLDLGTATWTRILLGSFPSREAAIMFADQFNSEENLQTLVVSSSN